MKVIKANFIIKALDKKYLTGIDMDPEKLPFNDIFGDKLRIAIPMKNEKIQEILNMLMNGETNSGNLYTVDLNRQKASRVVTTNNGEKIIESRLGKVIRKELGEEWSDEFSRQMASENKGQDTSEYIVILSRSPIDIVRMSDHYGWDSCHSPPGKNSTGVDYFYCTFQEANNGGFISYIVRKSDYEEIKDELQSAEIFSDNQRNIRGISPISRYRVNRYVNEEDDTELAVPTSRNYGKEIAGFHSTLRNFLNETQKDKIDKYKNKFDVNEWVRYGGSYADEEIDSLLFEDFLPLASVSGRRSDYYGDESETIHDLWENELEIYSQKAESLKYFKMWASIEDRDIIFVDASVYFTFSGVVKKNSPIKDEDHPINSWYINRRIIELDRALNSIKTKIDQGESTPEELNKLIEKKQNMLQEKSRKDFYEKLEDIIAAPFLNTDVALYIKGDTILIQADIDVEEISNPDDFRILVEECADFEKRNYSETYYEIYQFLIENNLLIPYETERAFSLDNFKNLSLSFDKGTYEVDAYIAMIHVPTEHREQIAKELYDMIFSHIENLRLNPKQPLLFPVKTQPLNSESLPSPDVSITDETNVEIIPDPEYPRRRDWIIRRDKKIDVPTGNSVLNISFTIPFNDLEKYDDYQTEFYLSHLDKSIESISKEIMIQLPGIIKRYEQDAVNNKNSTDIAFGNWHHKKTYSSKNWYKKLKHLQKF